MINIFPRSISSFGIEKFIKSSYSLFIFFFVAGQMLSFDLFPLELNSLNETTAIIFLPYGDYTIKKDFNILAFLEVGGINQLERKKVKKNMSRS